MGSSLARKSTISLLFCRPWGIILLIDLIVHMEVIQNVCINPGAKECTRKIYGYVGLYIPQENRVSLKLD
jgi:hypothetical protein